MSDKVINKREFTVEVDGETVKLAVVRPSNKVTQAATLVYNRAFRQAETNGAYVRLAVERVMRKQGLWGDEQQAKYETLIASMRAGELSLAKGGMKKSAGRAIALRMIKERAEVRVLNAERNELDGMTAESQAQQDQFEYLVANCTVYSDTGKLYFDDTEDYLAHKDEPLPLAAAQNLGKLMYGLDDDYQSKFPENKFLLKYGFAKIVDGRVWLTNKDGKLTDMEGRLVNEKGRYINDNGEAVDVDGNRLTEDGEYKVDFVEFSDDADAA